MPAISHSSTCAATTEKLRGPVTNRPYGLLARAHRLVGFPGAGGNTAAGLSIDQQGQADASVSPLERGQHGIAHMRDTGVNGRGLRLDLVLRAYMICLRCRWGSVSRRRRTISSSSHRGGMAMGDGCQPDGNSDLLKPAARPNNTCFTIKRS